MGELFAAISAAAPAAAGSAAGTGAGAAAGMLGPASFGTTEGLMAAAAPMTTADLLGGSAFGTADAGLLGQGMKGLDLAGSGMGGGTASLFGDPNGLDFLKWSNPSDKNFPIKAAQEALKMMQNDTPTPQASGKGPPGYNPSEPMEKQFARIMGWLQENGGRL